MLINHELCIRNREELSHDKIKRLINLMNKMYILLYDEEKTKKYIVIDINIEKEYKSKQLYYKETYL